MLPSTANIIKFLSRRVFATIEYGTLYVSCEKSVDANNSVVSIYGSAKPFAAARREALCSGRKNAAASMIESRKKFSTET